LAGSENPKKKLRFFLRGKLADAEHRRDLKTQIFFKILFEGAVLASWLMQK
jgi:hypothetical protein